MLVGFVIIGGIRRIAEVAGKLVPAMIVLYIGAALLIITMNIAAVPEAIGLIFTHAFTPSAATGGFAGAAVAAAVRYGVARGVFSNESGLGSAAIAHAAAKTKSPVRQGVIAMLGTFIDTIVVCTMTALTILTSGAWTFIGADGGGLTGGGAHVHGLSQFHAWWTLYRHYRVGRLCVHHDAGLVVLWRTVLAVHVRRTQPDGVPRIVGDRGVEFCQCESRSRLEPGRYAQRPDGRAESCRVVAAGADGVQGHARVL